jgi:hypothetical protein
MRRFSSDRYNIGTIAYNCAFYDIIYKEKEVKRRRTTTKLSLEHQMKSITILEEQLIRQVIFLSALYLFF